jgi:hypothetical protein
MALLAIILFVPLAARAQGSAEVQTYLDSVSRLYEALEYERALEQIANAKRLTRGAEDDVALALYQGIILADLGKKEESRAAFKAALFLKPEAELPVQVAPKVKQMFEGLRQQVKQEPASVRVKREAERQRLEAQQPRVEVLPQQETRSRVPLAPETAPAPVATAQLQQVEVKPPQEALSAGNVSQRATLRSRALIPAIAGGVLLAAGGVSWGLAMGEQSRLRSGDPSLTSHEDVQRSVSRGQSFQTVGLGLMGASVVGLGLAAGFYVLGAPEAPLALGAGTDGTSAFVYGRWP